MENKTLLTFVLPRVSDFMETAVVQMLAVAPGKAFARGDVLVQIVVEMEIDGDTLACPPGMSLELVAAEPGTVIDWKVVAGQSILVGGLLATVASPDAKSASSNRLLRCVPRELLE